MVKLMSEVTFPVRPRERLRAIKIPDRILERFRREWKDVEFFQVTIKPFLKLPPKQTKEPEEPREATPEKPEEREEELEW